MNSLPSRYSLDTIVTAAYDHGWRFPVSRKMHLSEIFNHPSFVKCIARILSDYQTVSREGVVNSIGEISEAICPEHTKNMTAAEIWRDRKFHEKLYIALNI